MRKKKKTKAQTQICCDGVNTAILVCKGNKFIERKNERQRPCGSFVFIFVMDGERLHRFHDSIHAITDSVFIILLFYCWCSTDTGGHIKKGIQKRWRLCTDTVCCHRIVAEKTKKTEFIKCVAPTIYCSTTTKF